MYRIGEEEIEAIRRVIETRSMFKVNNKLQESYNAEKEIGEYWGTNYDIFMTSGHAALVSALTAMGIGPGDEVIVPAYTYISTAMAVVSVGAIPIIAEVDETLTISPADIEKKITERTKAIMPVHIQGFPCNMDAITKIAKQHGIYVLEDACQSVGGSYNGKLLGTIGDAGALSFNYFKIISSGEGGALLTNNREIFERALIYHDSAAIAFFGNQMEGFTTEGFCGEEYRSNELCAAVIRVQLTRLDGILRDLRKNKKYLMDRISDICRFIPSNDIEGDCGTALGIYFDTPEEARAFRDSGAVPVALPIEAGRHIYKNWEPIMKKRGAFNPLMDPFKMPANKDIVPDYNENMCPETLKLLALAAYVPISPDDTTEELDRKVAAIREALSH